MPLLGSVNIIYINGSGEHVEFQIGNKITNSYEIHQKNPSLFLFGQEVSENKMLSDNDDENYEKVTTIVCMVFWTR